MLSTVRHPPAYLTERVRSTPQSADRGSVPPIAEWTSPRFRAIVAGIVIAVAASACSGDDDGGGSPVVDVGEQAVGTCLDFTDEVGAEVLELPNVPCSDPHSHEIFAIAESGQDVYPGFEALETEAQALCLGAFEPYVGINAFDSELFYSWLVPTLTSWDREDDREIICVIGNTNGAPLVGTVQGAAR